MKVTIEIKTLIEVIDQHNPGMDLTGLKAYLFDLIVDGDKVEAVPPRRVNRRQPPAPPTPETPDALAINWEPETFELEGEAEEDPLDKIARQAIGSVSPSLEAANEPPRRGKKKIKDRLHERQAKRKEMENFSNMSSKQIMESLVNRAMPKKKEGQNQFVDMGAEEEAAGADDMVLG